ncbi:MAG: hypothetical protein RBJ76_00710 [Stenomitos frigidus ULC029]
MTVETTPCVLTVLVSWVGWGVGEGWSCLAGLAGWLVLASCQSIAFRVKSVLTGQRFSL